MTNEQPEQWAKDLLEAVQDASDIGMACGMVDCPQCANAALTIQRAFAEHEAELVAENAKLREALGRILTRTELNMSACFSDYESKLCVANDIARQALAQQDTTALKSREAGHG